MIRNRYLLWNASRLLTRIMLVTRNKFAFIVIHFRVNDRAMSFSALRIREGKSIVLCILLTLS